MSNQYKHKYLKYKQKYLTLIQQNGGDVLIIKKQDGSEISGFVDDGTIEKLNHLAKDNYIDPPVNLQDNNYAIKLKLNDYYSIETDNDPSFTEAIDYIFESNIQDVPKIRDGTMIDFSNYNIPIKILFDNKPSHMIIYIRPETVESLKRLPRNNEHHDQYVHKTFDDIIQYNCLILKINENEFKITSNSHLDKPFTNYTFKLEDLDDFKSYSSVESPDVYNPVFSEINLDMYNIPIQILQNTYETYRIYITKELLDNLKTLRSDSILSGMYKLGDKIYECSISRTDEQIFKITDYNNFTDASLFYNFKLSEDVDSLGASKSTSGTSLSLSASSLHGWTFYSDYNFYMINGTFSQYNMEGLTGEDAIFGSCTMNALKSIDVIIEKLRVPFVLNITSTEIDYITNDSIKNYYLPWAKNQQRLKQGINATFHDGFTKLKYNLKYDNYSFDNFTMVDDYYFNNLIYNKEELKQLIINFLNESKIIESREIYIPVILIKGTITIALFIPTQIKLPYYIFNSHSHTLIVNGEPLNIKTTQIYLCPSLDIFVNTILIIAPPVENPDRDAGLNTFNQFEIHYLLPKSTRK
jgi:hypothetical protein